MNKTGWSARWTGSITPSVTGKYNLALTSAGGSRLYIDDKLVIDNWGDHPLKSKMIKRRLTADQAYTLWVEYSQTGESGEVRLSWLTPADDPNQEAAVLAAQADVAIVVVGANSGEGGDRQSLVVSDEALLATVVKANPHVVVVVYNPAQVLLPWVNQVQAVLLGWIPGQEGGNALADVLFGDVNPSGRLPITFANIESDYPANTPQMYPGTNGRVLYSEGLQVGYRHFDSQDIQPLFPFGYGLSYSTFEYSNLSVTPATTTDGAVAVTVDIKNSSQRPGNEVVQLYLGFPSETSEPPSQLKGFQKLLLLPGEARQVTFTLTPDDYSFWSAGMEQWVAYPGIYKVMVGSSSREILQSGTFAIENTSITGTVYQAEEAALAGSVAIAADFARVHWHRLCARLAGTGRGGFLHGRCTRGGQIQCDPALFQHPAPRRAEYAPHSQPVRQRDQDQPGGPAQPRQLEYVGFHRHSCGSAIRTQHHRLAIR